MNWQKIFKSLKRSKKNFHSQNKIVSKLAVLFVLNCAVSSLVVAAESTDVQSTKSQAVVNSTKSKKIVFKQAPEIKPGQYTYFYEENYHIFTTRKIDNIAYSHHCFKTKKPDCEAIRLSTLNNITIKLTNPEMQNYASAYCLEIYGKNMVVFDHEKKEYNFCRFQDGSLVASWALYKAKNPKIIVDYK